MVTKEVGVAAPNDLIAVLHALDECKRGLDEIGINQWDEVYPNEEIVNAAIERESLYIIRKNDVVIAGVGLDTGQPEEYSTVNWQCSPPALVVHHLFVHAGYWRQGFAATLMQFAESIASGKSCLSIRLDAYSGNPAALGLYANRGYDHVGEVVFPRRKLLFVCFEKATDRQS